MQNFISRFIVIAVVGTAIVYFGTPALKQAMGGRTPEFPARAAAVTMLKDQLGFFFVSDEQPFADTPSAPTLPATATTPTARTGDTPLAPDAPAAAPQAPTGGARWAVVWQPETRAYSRDGKYIGRLNPGAFLEIVADATSGGKPFIVARVLEGEGKNTEAVVQAGSVMVVPGHWEQVSAGVRGLYLERAGILGEMDRIRNSSLREDNPYAAQYAASRDKYKQFWTRVKKLQEKRDTGTGDHMQYSDELRMMKGEDIRVGKAFEAAKQKYDDWNAQNPVSTRTSPKLQQLSDQLASIDSKLAGAGNEASTR